MTQTLAQHIEKRRKYFENMLRPYNEAKAQYPDAIVLLRVGDFYETFGEDAVACSDIIGLTLTRRINGDSYIYITGFPCHALQAYLSRLIKAGRRVAFCGEIMQPMTDYEEIIDERPGYTVSYEPTVMTEFDKIICDKAYELGKLDYRACYALTKIADTKEARDLLNHYGDTNYDLCVGSA